MDETKETEKKNNYKAGAIVALSAIIIGIINITLLNYLNVIHLCLSQIDAFAISIILVPTIYVCLYYIFDLEEKFEEQDSPSIQQDNNQDMNVSEEPTNSNDYSFVKSKIDKLDFKNPSQMANYFYDEFGEAPSFDCTLRMTVFAYNYFNIEELAKSDTSFQVQVRRFNKSFKNADELKKCTSILSTLDINENIASYSTLKFLIFRLFRESKLCNEYWDLLNKKEKELKYKRM